MRYLIVSDIHSNIEALSAVFNYFVNEKVEFDKVVCLGDLVGYGANPNEVVDYIKKYDPVIILGNHDLSAVGREEPFNFRDYAKNAILWTRKVLNDEHKDYLRPLPPTEKDDFIVINNDLTIGHGWLYDSFVYLRSANQLETEKTFKDMPTNVFFFGHTHVPVVYEQGETPYNNFAINIDNTLIENRIPLEKDKKYVINPGSVGQPRDGNPFASCIVFDTEYSGVTFYRVCYDYVPTQKKIREAGLAPILADRLERGI